MRRHRQGAAVSTNEPPVARLNFRRRPPDFVIGGMDRPYLFRWYLIQTKYFRVFLHKLMRDDDDRALHDHPWPNVSILLRGEYVEVTPDFGAMPTPFARIADMPLRRRHCGPGTIIARRAIASHRLELFDQTRPVWTLFIAFRRCREWGFHCPRGWRHWSEFVDARDIGAVGKGCE